MLTGTDAADNLSGQRRQTTDLKGLGGNDTLHGEAGSDVLDGGTGNDLLDGGDGVDLARFGGSTAVVVDLGRRHRQARQRDRHADQHPGGDRLQRRRHLQGRRRRQLVPGRRRQGRRHRRRLAATSTTSTRRRQPAGSASRDVITDFAHGRDKIDLTGIDADTTVAGNQAFRWVGTAALPAPASSAIFTSGGNTIMRASTDADAAASSRSSSTRLRQRLGRFLSVDLTCGIVGRLGIDLPTGTADLEENNGDHHVTTAADVVASDGVRSLREAVALANANAAATRSSSPPRSRARR